MFLGELCYYSMCVLLGGSWDYHVYLYILLWFDIIPEGMLSNCYEYMGTCVWVSTYF